MARPSTIEQLPPDILEQLQALLRDPRVSQLETTARINAILEDRGEQPVSKSAVNRYAVRMAEVGDRLRQSRQVAEMWIGKMGAMPQGQLGHLINEMLRTLSFELSDKLMQGELTDKSLPAVIKMVKELSLSVMRLEKAASDNVKREREIRDDEHKRALEEAAARAEENARAQGLDEDQARFWREKVLGVR